MHMDLDGKLMGVKKKYLLLGIPVVIIAALYIRSRESSSTAATDTTGTDTTGASDGGVPDPTTGSTVAGSGDGSSSGTPTDVSSDPSSSSLNDPYATEVGDLLQVIAGFQASAQPADDGGVETLTPSAPVASGLVKKTTGEPAKHVTAKPAAKKPAVAKKPAAHSTAAHPASHHAAPAGPGTHVTAATPSHASPGKLSDRRAAAKTPAAAPRKPVSPPKKQPPLKVSKAAVKRNT